MALPQFTGEASLYKSSAQYRMKAGPMASAGGVAIPQFTWCGPCIDGRQFCVIDDPPLSLEYWRPCVTPPDPCAHCRTAEECCICGGGIWNGHVCS